MSDNQVIDEQKYAEHMYKKWFRSKDKSGFLSITPWFDPEKNIAKLTVDIGESDPNTNKLLSSTNAYVDAHFFGAYLKSIANGSAVKNFPAGYNEKTLIDKPTPESHTFYGGSGNTARVFRIHHWALPAHGSYDDKAFVWKIGHFESRGSSSNGAIIPDMSKPISKNMIKVSRLDIVEISYIIDMEMTRR
jgi:hypothetical protein